MDMVASIKELATELGDNDQGVAYKAYKSLEAIATRASAPDNGPKRAKVAAELAADLNAMTKPEKDDKGKDKPRKLIHSSRTRNKIIRLLSYVAGAKEVPALAKILGDLDLREMARFALDRNTSDEATTALIKALDDEVGPCFRSGLVNALGRRKGVTALAALKSAAEDEDRQVRIVAVEALSNFADASSDALIVKATKADCPRCRARAHKARVRLAETLCRKGNKSAAKRICNAIRASDACPPQKEAAERVLKAMD